MRPSPSGGHPHLRRRHVLTLGALAAALAVALVVPATAHEGVGSFRDPSMAEQQAGESAGRQQTDLHDEHGKPVLPPVDVPDGHTGAAPGEGVEYVAGRQGWTGGHVITRGDRLYVGSYGIGMRIYDVADPTNPTLVGGYTPPQPRADAVPEAGEFGGRHVAVLNGTRRVTRPQQLRTDRSEFLDVTDPAAPVLLHEFVGADDGEAHVGRFAFGKRLWLPAGGSGTYGGDGGLPEEERPAQGDLSHHRGLRIYDLAPTIDTPAVDCAPDAGWDNPCAPTLLFAGNPVELWEASPHRRDRDVGHLFTHTHDVAIHEDRVVPGLGRRDIALLAEGGSYLDDAGNTGSVFVLDITDPAAPVVLNRFIHPGYDDGRRHDSIRYYHEAQFLDGDPSVMIVTDEDLHSGCDAGGAIYFVRVSADLTEATPLSEWHIPTDTPAAVCSVHNFTTEGPFVFIGSYNAGLQVLDVSDPTDPQRAGYFIAEGSTAWGAQYHADGYVFVGDMTRGLDVFRFSALAGDPPGGPPGDLPPGPPGELPPGPPGDRPPGPPPGVPRGDVPPRGGPPGDHEPEGPPGDRPSERGLRPQPSDGGRPRALLRGVGGSVPVPLP